MAKKRVLYLHGLKGGPNGSKARYLRDHPDIELRCPQLKLDYITDFVEETNSMPMGEDPMFSRLCEDVLAQATMEVNEFKPDVIVGSSFGGGLALEMHRRGRWKGPLVLLAPAGIKLFGIGAIRSGHRMAVLHGKFDKVIPVTHSVALAENSRTFLGTMLMLMNDDHRLHSTINEYGDKEHVGMDEPPGTGRSALVNAIEWAMPK